MSGFPFWRLLWRVVWVSAACVVAAVALMALIAAVAYFGP